jgi:hypothetical protein
MTKELLLGQLCDAFSCGLQETHETLPPLPIKMLEPRLEKARRPPSDYCSY